MIKRSQVALEFLMTYGWAMLIILIAFGSLAYFGMFNPEKVLPDNCLFGNGLTCVDGIIRREAPNTYNVTLVLQNTLGQTMYSLRVKVDTVNCSVLGSQNLASEDKRFVECNVTSSSFSIGKKAKVKMTANYRRTASGLDQASIGEIYATVQ
ncbi:TPA: hypothetical protein HA235_03990 [Candidatus Woesearchaeota archaeon]|nr:hypothetical protein [Candidatus Woesearchaeota archaeon]HIH55443.1 hypothetical protein [Candidatus Woesearchaeota archaeon]HIJ01917.1 hypothetical protein [Candidatus Woesearchaeota archaeon]HIJ13758.1 hypothetical protein [Candidatus Woesearchaeota archaeon]